MTQRTASLEMAARMAACYDALDRYATAGIQDGAVTRVINAAVRFTAEVERMEAWCSGHPGLPLPNVWWQRARGASRDLLDAYLELQERG